ncbi:hypothetical protein [Paracoccus sulfuroxidans]|uniref:Component of SufBCD complex n=1 Tax=Paracoccus sulfuroxidans TaxID=384678 RepID=A0A562NHF5_9RHOB|nr:hypothetical protein [Paracoccus sulfuroxidans]TWI31534.1 hypothetical protein IQ24_02986 [Paracoccus sulfuroxidans]
MRGLDGILALLDSRSFGSIWFWILLTAAWTLVGRRVLGVPVDVLQRVPPEPGPEDDLDALVLLDWLSLSLPRWQIQTTEALLITGAVTFLFSALLILGFGYGLEMAQALCLLGLPFLLLLWLNYRLARRLGTVLEGARTRQISPNTAAIRAAGMMRRHRWLVFGLSVVAVAATAFLGALWAVRHPFGF